MTFVARRITRIGQLMQQLDGVESELRWARATCSVLLSLAALLGVGPLAWSFHWSLPTPLVDMTTMLWFGAVAGLAACSSYAWVLRIRRVRILGRLMTDTSAPR